MWGFPDQFTGYGRLRLTLLAGAAIFLQPALISGVSLAQEPAVSPAPSEDFMEFMEESPPAPPADPAAAPQVVPSPFENSDGMPPAASAPLPDSVPVPVPETVPAPAPPPEPQFAPDPAPLPEPAPVPAPEVVPEVPPAPQPEPQAQPAPQPESQAAPEPAASAPPSVARKPRAPAPKSPPAVAPGAKEDILSPRGSWKVDSGQIEISPGQSVTYCAISNTYPDNGRLEFYGTQGQLAAIKIDVPGRAFRGDQSFTVRLRMPATYDSAVPGSVVGTSTLIMNVKGDRELASALHNGKLLYVGLDGHEYPFSLSGINKFNERLRTCSSPGWGEMIHDYVFKKGPAEGPDDRSGIESETLKILASPPKSDPAMPVRNIPPDTPPPPPPYAPAPETLPPLPAESQFAPQTAPQMLAPAMEAAPGRPGDVSISRPRPIVPTAEPSYQAAPPAYAPPVQAPAPPGADMRAAPEMLVPPQQAESAQGTVLARMSESQPVSPPLPAPSPAVSTVAPPAPVYTSPPVPPAYTPSPAPMPQAMAPAPAAQEGFDELFGAGASPAVRPPADPPQMAAPLPAAGMVQSPEAYVPGPQEAQRNISSSPAPKWRALKGSSLREVLALWSLDNGVELIWNAEEQYRVKETISLSSSYENAVETLLKQYELGFLSPSVKRPVGQLYVDPVQKKKVLVIRSQAD